MFSTSVGTYEELAVHGTISLHEELWIKRLILEIEIVHVTII
jgi:hypothetical protein